jgi:hypothetical protein
MDEVDVNVEIKIPFKLYNKIELYESEVLQEYDNIEDTIVDILETYIHLMDGLEYKEYRKPVE